MTDPYSRPADPVPGEPTVPAASGNGQLPDDLTPAGPPGWADPWSSGPGLGTGPAPVGTSPTGTPDAGIVPVPPVQPAPQPPVQAWPDAPSAAPYQQPAPAPQAPYQQPAPAPQASYQQPPYAQAYPEPNGPANQISTPAYSTYAPSAYAGQSLPAITDPVAHDYGYNRPQAGSTHPKATASLVLGIVGLVAFSPVAPIAWYLAASARREMATDPQRWQSGGTATAGLVMGIIGTILLGLSIVLLGIIFMTLVASGN